MSTDRRQVLKDRIEEAEGSHFVALVTFWFCAGVVVAILAAEPFNQNTFLPMVLRPAVAMLAFLAIHASRRMTSCKIEMTVAESELNRF